MNTQQNLNLNPTATTVSVEANLEAASAPPQPNPSEDAVMRPTTTPVEDSWNVVPMRRSSSKSTKPTAAGGRCRDQSAKSGDRKTVPHPPTTKPVLGERCQDTSARTESGFSYLNAQPSTSTAGQPTTSKEIRCRIASAETDTGKTPSGTAVREQLGHREGETQREPQPSAEKVPPKKHHKKKNKRGKRGIKGPKAAAGTSTSEPMVKAKRARPDDSLSPRGDAKRAKVNLDRAGAPPSYATAAQACPAQLSVAVVLRPSGDLSAEQAERIKESIHQAMMAEISSSTPLMEGFAPAFRGRPFLSEGALKM